VSDDHDHAHGGFLDELLGGKAEVVFAALGGLTVAVGWFGGLAGMPENISWGLYLASYFFGGYFAILEVIGKLRHGKFQIDFLMLVSASGAAALGEWAEGALLLFLFSVGHALENYAMARARASISALADLAPDTARVRRDGEESEVAVEDLVVGDIVLVRSNERLPADGVVVAGQSSVNQAPVTGESTPVDKSPVADLDAALASDSVGAEHRVFAGTINGTGSLEVYVTRLASESTLARVVEMVSSAQTRKAPSQRFTDRFERVFVPFVILLAFVVAFSWVVIDEPMGASFYRSMAVLVAASPCALAIATPSAVLSGVARAAHGGVLIKGGAPLESLGALDAIAFDKTGTLTLGEPHLVDIKPLGDTSPDELIRISAAVEALSDHPLARAVLDRYKELFPDTDLADVSDFESLTGRGLAATIEGARVHLGKPVLFSEIEGPDLPAELAQIVSELEGNGRTTMVVRRGSQFLGALGLMDTPRPTAKAVIATLRQLGVKRMMMISGDNQRVADAVAVEVGLDEAFGDLLPQDKVEKIRELSDGIGVAMVGDGVNDAPAMAHATVGIAMGAAGSDVALETADVALMADDLETLPFAVGLSRATRRIIRQNLWASLGVVALLVPATLFGLGIGPAVLVHEGSTLIVVANALRLLAYKKV